MCPSQSVQSCNLHTPKVHQGNYLDIFENLLCDKDSVNNGSSSINTALVFTQQFPYHQR